MVCCASTSHAIPVEREVEAEPGAAHPPAASGRTAKSLRIKVGIKGADSMIFEISRGQTP